MCTHKVYVCVVNNKEIDIIGRAMYTALYSWMTILCRNLLYPEIGYETGSRATHFHNKATYHNMYTYILFPST